MISEHKGHEKKYDGTDEVRIWHGFTSKDSPDNAKGTILKKLTFYS